MANINICTAMCDSNRGIGLGDGFPWPFIKEDFQYYSALTQLPKDPSRKVGHIKGRHTWEYTCLEERSASAVINVVISSKLSEDSDPYLHKVVASFEEAVEYLTSGPHSSNIETIWAMGGTRVYESAIKNSRCKSIYLTRIFGDYKSDTFFPKFEDMFRKKSAGDLIEDNGVRYCFEVHERIV